MMPKSNPDRRATAYKRLGVAPNDVLASPKITPFLKRLCGVERAIDFLRGSDDAIARKFIAVYDDPLLLGKTMKDLLPIEAFALAAGISPMSLKEVVVLAAVRESSLEGALIAAINHKEIVDTTIAEARKSKGLKDREMLLRHSGFLPTPKGAQINIQAVAHSQSTSAAASQATAPAPSPEDTIRRLEDRFNEHRKGALTAQELPQLMEPAETVPAIIQQEETEQMYDEP